MITNLVQRRYENGDDLLQKLFGAFVEREQSITIDIVQLTAVHARTTVGHGQYVDV